MPGALRRPEKRVRAVLGRRLRPARCWLVSSSFRPGGWRRGSVASLRTRLYPFQPAAASGICAGRGRRPPVPREPDSGGGHVHAEALPPVPAGAPLCRPCPQVPASLHAPASCSAWRPGAGRGSGTPWSIPGAAGRCPRRGPGRRALPPVRNIRGSRGCRSPPCGRPLFPGPWSCRGRSCPRNGADGVDRGPFRTRARRWRCGQPGRGPSIPPPGKTATGVLPSPTPPERRWRPGPKAEVNGGNAGRCRLASQHAGRHRTLRTFRPVETPSRPQGSRPDLPPFRADGLSRGFVRRRVSACRIPKALSSPVVCHL